MKYRLFVILIVLFLNACEKKEDVIDNKQKTIDSLKAELNRETDKKLFDVAYTLMQNHSYDAAIVKFKEMQSKYPSSELYKEADRNIAICDDKIKQSYKVDKANFDKLINKCTSEDVEVAISDLNAFINSDKPIDLRNIATKELEKYEKEYEKVKDEREAQKETGLQIVSVVSDWDVSGYYGDQLLKPNLKIKIKNISSNDVDRIYVKVQFLNKEQGEVFGDGSSYVVGSSDPPLTPGYTKTAYIDCSVGYKSDFAALNLPKLTAKIYLEQKYGSSVFFKEVAVSRTYNGLDFNKK